MGTAQVQNKRVGVSARDGEIQREGEKKILSTYVEKAASISMVQSAAQPMPATSAARLPEHDCTFTFTVAADSKVCALQ